MRREKREKVKKPIYKKWWFWLIIFIVVTGTFGKKSPQADMSNVEETVKIETDTNAATDVSADGVSEIYAIVGDEIGNYGFEVVFNKGTQDEITKIGYKLPVGNYKCTANTGFHSGQITVCSEETHIVDGFEEPIDIPFVAMVKADETVEFSLNEGYYFTAGINGSFTIEKIG